MQLSAFVLIGTILSYDQFFATVEFNLNPIANGGPSLAILPINSIPCKIELGRKIYVVKAEEQDVPIISCEK